MSLRAHGRSVSIPDAPHEFRLSRRWLLQRAADAGFVVEEARGCRIAMRVLRRAGAPGAAAWLYGDRLDQVLGRLPLLHRLGEAMLLRARKL
jgi:hypothetical protein